MFDKYLGAHVSISGGVGNAIDEAQVLGCGVAQIFTANASRWEGKNISKKDIETFLENKKRSEMEFVSHDSYLINLASPNIELREKSILALSRELMRCSSLNIRYLVMHPGSHVGSGEEVGIENIIRSLNKVLENIEYKIKILLETTAGQGTNLGYNFNQLSQIRDGVEKKDLIGFCFDTCHVFASGYDLRDKKEYDKVINEFDKLLGLENLFVIHLNDSKKDLKSRVDRHEHIGEGFIGKKAFELIMNDKRLKQVYKIIETSKGIGEADDRIADLNLLKSFVKK